MFIITVPLPLFRTCTFLHGPFKHTVLTLIYTALQEVRDGIQQTDCQCTETEYSKVSYTSLFSVKVMIGKFLSMQFHIKSCSDLFLESTSTGPDFIITKSVHSHLNHIL